MTSKATDFDDQERVPLRKSLALKVIAAVVLAQLFILSAVGYVYVRQLTNAIDSTVINRLQTIGALLQDSHLKYAALADRDVLTELVGEELIDGMVVGVNGTIYHSLDKKRLGKSVSKVSDLQLNWFNPTNVEPQLISLQEGGDTSLISVTPIFTMNSTRPFLFGYIKLDSTGFTDQKEEVVIDVILGIIACIFLSSLIIYLFLRRFVFRRVSIAADFTASVAVGKLNSHLKSTSKDELGVLEVGLNRMTFQLLSRKNQRDEAELRLLEANENLEKGVQERTEELSSTMEDLRLEADSHKQTSQALKRQGAFMHLLQRIIVSSNETSSLDDAWVVGLSSMCRHFRWPVGVAYTLDKGSRDILSFSGQVFLEDNAAYGDIIQSVKKLKFGMGEGLVGGVLRSGRPQWMTIQSDSSAQSKAAYECGLLAAFALPVLVGREVVAVLEFYTNTEDHQDSELFEVARDIGIQLGRVVERRRAADYLNRAKIASDVANVAKTEFISKLGHELRTPINAIVGFGELIYRQLPEDDAHKRDQLDVITRAGRHMVRLVDQVTDLAKIEIGEMPLNVERVDLLAEVKSTIERLTPLTEQKHISFDGDYSSIEHCYVEADVTALGQILLNLFTNAIHYGGKLQKIHLSIEEMIDGSTVLLNIRDHGDELSQNEQEEIFQPLVRLDRHRGVVDGLGIGLTLSQELMREMGGTITVQSNHSGDLAQDECGNSFTIRFRKSAS